MIELLVGVILGGVISWVIAYYYYRQSSKQAPEWAQKAPEWARPLIEKLPDAPISSERLVRLYHEALEKGKIDFPDPMSGYVECPRCGAPASDFEPWEDYAHDSRYVGTRCGKCGKELSGGEV